jgi:protein-disulfide isomerase
MRQEFPGQTRSRTLTLNRRELLTTTAVLILAGATISGAALPRFISLAQAEAGAPSPEDLAHAGPDGDVVLGSDKAPVTIIEYASMTCPHCAHFSMETFPELKKRYIDTGKVRFIFREFPLDALAAAGFMLARCAGNDKFMAVVETLFAKQAEWIVKEPIPQLEAIAKQFGFSHEAFNECLANQKRLDNLTVVRDYAVDKLAVNSTPTFFVNGKRLVGDQSIEQLTKEIDPYLKDG